MKPWDVETGRGVWRVCAGEEKLALRASLPGAYGFDQAAHGFRRARAAGAPMGALVPAAMPASWMVNNKASSPVFQRWLTPPVAEAWEALADTLVGGAPQWQSLEPDLRDELVRVVGALCTAGQGAAAVSKVLALLVPETVPLMDDAAVWWALGAVPRPDTADAPQAGAAVFAPMLDWFSAAQAAQPAALTALARAHHAAVLDGAQVLDRLLWFDSWGWRLFARMPVAAGEGRWWWVEDGGREAVVRVVADAGVAPGDARVSLAEAPETFAAEARAALEGAG